MDHFVNVDIYLRFIVAFVLVLLLIGLAVWLARLLGFNTFLKLKGNKERRLTVVEVITLDSKRRLVLVTRDDIEHLICIGGSNDFVIEACIRPSLPSINQDLI